MRCLMCENLSLKHICKSCQKQYLTPSLYKRYLEDGTLVLSFYKYHEIKELLHTKHTDIGFYIYNILAQNSLKKFAGNFSIEDKFVSIAIDDNPKQKYSHTAVLNRTLHSSRIKPIYNRLIAKNSVSYSGKSKAFRLSNPRNFQLKAFKQKRVILLDDIITTGTTLLEAVKVLKASGKEVLLCLTLCDVSQK
ncbi:MAG: phosphoribosyltransferase family protein [Sulfurimonas sp.]|nr:phosphoribosyltransferase family protein [Sulfurimonas sp.]MDQ7067412.1 phosphoribosyltransferase family protein [Sulfurimonas sp.]